MVDSRLKGEWLGSPQFEDLSDTAWRVFTLALMWSNTQGTDGLIPARYFDRLHPDGRQADATDELIRAGFVVAVDGDFQIPKWDADMGQSSSAYVADRREKNRQKQQAFRDRQNVTSSGVTSGSSIEPFSGAGGTGDVTGYQPGYVGQAQAKEVIKEGIGKSEPSLFCQVHPRGTTTPCVSCRNARLLHEQWDRTQRNKPTRTTPSYADPETCLHRSHPVENYCLDCETRLTPLELSATR